MFHRLCKPLLSNSFFIFGARATGKSTLLNSILVGQRTLNFDLLKAEVEEELATSPDLFEKQVLGAKDKIDWVVVDEVQRIPKLLNSIHRLIESHQIRFAITGSSARKLRRGAANLLAGRAYLNMLFPMTSFEVHDLKLEEVLSWGSLPKVFSIPSENEKQEYLRSYAATFVQEEIKAEQIVRQLDPFRRFLEVAAQSNAKIINYSKIARDVGTDPKTVQSYYQILEDTLIGYFLEPYHTSVRKGVGQKPKFYFFDIGVQRALSKQLTMIAARKTSYFGELFESFFILECIRLNDYLKKDFGFYFLRTKDDVEIDLIVKRPGKPLLLMEIKSAEKADEASLKSFSSIAKDFKNADALCVYTGDKPLFLGVLRVLPWKEALSEVFNP